MAPTPSEYAERRRVLLAESPPGVARRRGLSALTDAWLRQVFVDAMGAAGSPVAALVAVGGYGRSELAPGSDLDLLLLHAGGERSDISALADKVWYPVWDSGVRLDHSVRTVEQARRLAASDLAVLLGLLDTRLVAGDDALLTRLREGVLGDWRAAAGRRLPELRAVWDERGQRSGDLRHDVEPDLKDGRGGLRDVVSLRAVAATWVADRPHRSVDEAARRLADVRDALHLTTGRAGNRLLLQEQDDVATELGMTDADVLLRHVGAAAATVTHAADATWRRALSAAAPRQSLLRRGRRPTVRLLGAGLAESDGEAALTAQADLADPMLPLRFAARAARAGLPLAPSSVDRLARQSRPLPEPWPGVTRDLFVELLGAGPPLVPVWEALDQAGIVDNLVPEWRRVRHRPQRTALHRFAVDRHLLETAVQAAALVREVRRPDLLLVAALLHDIGKGSESAREDHSVAGERIAAAVAARMGFDEDDAASITLLVRHHLLLADTATQRDLDDPATVVTVADVVESAEHLDLLAALTRVDAAATGPAAWSGWKEGLVAELVRRTSMQLSGAPPVTRPALTPAEQSMVDAKRLDVRAEPAADGSWTVTVAAPDRAGLFAAIAGVLALHRLPVRSAQVRTEHGVAIDKWVVVPEHGHEPHSDVVARDLARTLAGELDLTARLIARDRDRPRPKIAPAAARVELVAAASKSATVVEVRAADRPGLLYRLGRALALMGLDVRGARVATLGGEVVDVFYLQDGTGGALSESTARETVRLLTDAAG